MELGLTASLLCAYAPNSPTSKPGGNPPLLVLLLTLPLVRTLALSGGTGLTSPPKPTPARCCALLLIPNSPSVSEGEGDGETLLAGVFGPPVRSFHSATMLRTEARGERGDVCGRRKVDGCVGVVPVRVGVVLVTGIVVEVKVCVSVSVKTLAVGVNESVLEGLAERVIVVKPGGGDKKLDLPPVPDEDELVDDLVGEDGLDPYPYPVLLPYP